MQRVQHVAEIRYWGLLFLFALAVSLLPAGVYSSCSYIDPWALSHAWLLSAALNIPLLVFLFVADGSEGYSLSVETTHLRTRLCIGAIVLVNCWLGTFFSFECLF
jgi:hypothetical protein